jgi:hypothetical protein
MRAGTTAAKVAKTHLHRATLAEINKLLADKEPAPLPPFIKPEPEPTDAWDVVLIVMTLLLAFVSVCMVAGGALWALNYFWSMA